MQLCPLFPSYDVWHDSLTFQSLSFSSLKSLDLLIFLNFILFFLQSSQEKKWLKLMIILSQTRVTTYSLSIFNSLVIINTNLMYCTYFTTQTTKQKSWLVAMGTCFSVFSNFIKLTIGRCFVEKCYKRPRLFDFNLCLNRL